MKELTCKDCNEPFVLNDGEITFYEKKAFPLPRRCKSCRAKKRAQDHIDGKA